MTRSSTAVTTMATSNSVDIFFEMGLKNLTEQCEKFKKATESSEELTQFCDDLSSFINQYIRQQGQRLRPLLQEKMILDKLSKKLRFNGDLIKANQGNKLYCLLVADAYKKGDGVEQNREQAIFWYQKGVDKNDIMCVDALSILYCSSQNPEDHKKCVEILEKAVNTFRKKSSSRNKVKDFDVGIKNECLASIYRTYARCLREGLGTAKDLNRAIEFYEKAKNIHYYPDIDIAITECKDLLVKTEAEQKSNVSLSTPISVSSLPTSAAIKKETPPDNKTVATKAYWADESDDMTEEDYQKSLQSTDWKGVREIYIAAEEERQKEKKEQEAKTKKTAQSTTSTAPTKFFPQTPPNAWKRSSSNRTVAEATVTNSTRSTGWRRQRNQWG